MKCLVVVLGICWEPLFCGLGSAGDNSSSTSSSTSTSSSSRNNNNKSPRNTGSKKKGNDGCLRQTAAAFAAVPRHGWGKLVQGNGGKTSHTGSLFYAFDFSLPIGTEVVAARAGVVAAVRDEFTKGGPDPSMKAKANFVVVRHEDGTYARYWHLRHDSALVRKGEAVAEGQVLASSGNTGFTYGPHLHFDVVDCIPNDTVIVTWRDRGGEGVGVGIGKGIGKGVGKGGAARERGNGGEEGEEMERDGGEERRAERTEAEGRRGGERESPGPVRRQEEGEEPKAVAGEAKRGEMEEEKEPAKEPWRQVECCAAAFSATLPDPSSPLLAAAVLCEPRDASAKVLANAAVIKGRVALAARGGADFIDIALRAQSAGAVALLVGNTTEDDSPGGGEEAPVLHVMKRAGRKGEGGAKGRGGAGGAGGKDGGRGQAVSEPSKEQKGERAEEEKEEEEEEEVRIPVAMISGSAFAQMCAALAAGKENGAKEGATKEGEGEERTGPTISIAASPHFRRPGEGGRAARHDITLLSRPRGGREGGASAPESESGTNKISFAAYTIPVAFRGRKMEVGKRYFAVA